MNARTEYSATRPLSKLQIKALIGLGLEAFGQEFPPTGESFDEWRRRQVMMVCERPGLTACRNEDFLPLKAHFLKLAGRQEEAEAATLKAETEPRTWVMARLRKECEKAADVLPDALGYASGFIRHKRHVELTEADDKTLWHAVFVVRRKAEQLRKAG